MTDESVQERTNRIFNDEIPRIQNHVASDEVIRGFTELARTYHDERNQLKDISKYTTYIQAAMSREVATIACKPHVNYTLLTAFMKLAFLLGHMSATSIDTLIEFHRENAAKYGTYPREVLEHEIEQMVAEEDAIQEIRDIAKKLSIGTITIDEEGLHFNESDIPEGNTEH